MATMYGIARWYIDSRDTQQAVLGASFVPDYARYLGEDPRAVLAAMLDDLHVRHLRLVSYWSDIEASKGNYDFSELDAEFAAANARGAKVTLAIGLRQPRWPECHFPSWVAPENVAAWELPLNRFLAAVVSRYHTNPALESYQLENEYFLPAFGHCPDSSRDRLIREAALVRSLDPHHPLIFSRSQNAIGWPVGEPHGDLYGVSVYQEVWSPILRHYLVYPFPAWYYGFLAGAERLQSGRDTFIHELQAEPWAPHGLDIRHTTLEEQNKTFDAAQLRHTVSYAENTGMKRIDLWGAEYWYYRKAQLHDPSVWEAAQQIYKDNLEQTGVH